MYPHSLPHPNPLPLGEGTAMYAFLLVSTVFSNPATDIRLKLGAFLPLPAGAATAAMAGEGENYRKRMATTYLKPF